MTPARGGMQTGMLQEIGLNLLQEKLEVEITCTPLTSNLKNVVRFGTRRELRYRPLHGLTWID